MACPFRTLRKELDHEGKTIGYASNSTLLKCCGVFKNYNKSNITRKIHEEPENNPEIPFDVISEEILVRLPVKSLLRFKCVSKQWRSLIEDRRFIENQMSRAIPVLVRDCDDLGASAIPKPSYLNSNGFWRYEIIGVFDGLVVHRIWDKYYVKNPATMRTLALPDPLGHSRRIWFDFDLDRPSGEPKLLCEYSVMDGDFVTEKGYQILTIGKDEQWRDLTTPRGEDQLMALGPRNVHFLGLTQTEQDIELRVSSFDIRTERFTAHDFPRGVFSDLSKVFPFWWNNSLAVADLTDDAIRVAVLEERERWRGEEEEEELVVVPLSFLREKIYAKDKLVPVKAVGSTDLWFHYDGVCKFCYDTRTRRVKERGILANEKREVASFEYRPSLRSLDGMRPI